MSQQRLIGSPENTSQRIARREFRSDSARLFHREIHSPVLQLQQTLGNQRVAQLIQAKRLTTQGKIIGLQRKLTVGAAVDRYDPEAVRPADPGVRKRDNTPISARGSVRNEGNRGIQWRPGWRLAKSALAGDEEIVQPQPLMMRHAVQGQVKKEVASSLSPFKDGGRPLSNADRNLFAPGVDCDFNGARLHADRRAGKLARDVMYAQSGYRSRRVAGRQPLAPKSTHATQQGPVVSRVQRQPSADATCNGQAYDPKRMCCRNGKLVPQSPIKDVEECPDREQFVDRPNEYDGCSVPWFIRIGEDKDNPAAGRDTAFSDTSIHGRRSQAFVPTLPCDVHDKCYQTCNPDPVARELCDMKLIVDASRVCNNSTEDEDVRERCRKAVEKANYFLVRHGFGEESFEERQRQYCHCCPPPSHKPKKRQMIANTENVRLVEDPVHWDEEPFILRRLPKGTPVEFLHDGAGEKFNNTDTMYQWWFVRVGGVPGWVMQVLLDEVTESP